MPRLLAGRYRLIEPIDDKRSVWRAHDEVLRRRVAVKLLAAQPNDETRLRAGAQAAGLLHHPNVSAVHDYGVDAGEPFVVAELVDGTPLAARLARGPLSWRGAVEICAYVAAALSAGHARGLTHGAVTPDSVVLTDTGVKVVDFGTAAPLPARSPYLAPERRTGPAADVYALGVVLFTALTGSIPQPARLGLLHDDPDPTPLPLIPRMPLEVAAIYQHCLATDPGLRPSSAAIAQRLAVLAGVRVGAVDVRVPPPPAADDTVRLPGASGTREWTRDLSRDGTREFAVTPGRRRRGRRPVRHAVTAGAAVVAVLVGVAGTAAALGVLRSRTPDAAQWSVGSPASPRPAVSPTGTADPGGAAVGTAPPSTCTVSYQVKNAWPDGATVALSVSNTGRSGLREWALTFDLDGQVRADSAWNGTWQQEGTQVTVSGLPGHTDLTAGAAVNDVGVNVDGQHADRIPDTFHLNGARCQTAQS
ncbi:serine/threonine protein kinase PknA [Dactylosporangium fulvum]|uniref:serine/threonine-protein kinase n=1 Tax=Dactylosporangium fulvum TaxID=53359 RepID=UPI0031CDC6A2